MRDAILRFTKKYKHGCARFPKVIDIMYKLRNDHKRDKADLENHLKKFKKRATIFN